jgi:tetratricopeptide (TPR) repeat protein
LIAYYKNYYFETFSPLKHRTSKFFDDEKNMIETRVNLLFENYGNSAIALEKSLTKQDTGALGFIYANMGELKVAKQYIEKAMEYEGNLEEDNIKQLRLKYAHSLIDLKLGNLKSSANEIKHISNIYDKKIDKSYQLELFLKESLFDVQQAQKFFQKEREFVQYRNYQFIFYFSPFKIFNAEKSINLIKKGSVNIALGDTETATEYLEGGAKSSDVNKNIILAIKAALNKRLRIANQILKDIAKDTAEVKFFTVISETKSEFKKRDISQVDFYLATTYDEFDDEMQKPILINDRNSWNGKVRNLRYFVKDDISNSNRYAKNVLSQNKPIKPLMLSGINPSVINSGWSNYVVKNLWRSLLKSQ